MKKNHLFFLIAVLVFAAIVRIAYLVEFSKTPEFNNPGVDPAYHDYWAWALASGDWTPPSVYPDPKIRENPYFRPPGYSFFLAIIYKVFGHDYFMARLIQMLIGVLNCFLAYLLVKRLGKPVPALITAFLMAFYWAFIYFDAEFQDVTLQITFGLLLFLLLDYWLSRNRGWPFALMAGLAAGLFTVVRPNILIFIPFVALWMGWVAWKVDKRAAVSGILLLLAGLAVVIGPVTLRNYRVSGKFVLVSSNSGINLYIGNNSETDGVSTFIPELQEYLGRKDAWTCFDYPGIVKGIERKTSVKTDYSGANGYFNRKAVAFVRENPGKALKFILKKAAFFWGPREISSNEVLDLKRRDSAVLSKMPMAFPFILASGLIGLALALVRLFRNREERERYSLFALAFVFVAVYFLSYLPFFVVSRYRLPVVPFLFIAGSYFIHSIFVSLQQKRFKKPAVLGGLFVAVYLLLSVEIYPYAPDLSRYYTQTGLAYVKENKIELARIEYGKALALNPDNIEANISLGGMYLSESNALGAEKCYLIVLKQNPDDVGANVGLASALALLGRNEEAVGYFEKVIKLAPDNLQAHFNYALMLMRTGKLEQAKEHFMSVANAKPDDRGALINIGKISAEQGKAEEAMVYFKKAFDLNKNDGEVLFSMGNLLAEGGRYKEAGEYLSRALEVVPDNVMILLNLGNIYLMQKKNAKALDCYNRILRIDSSNIAATKNIEFLTGSTRTGN